MRAARITAATLAWVLAAWLFFGAWEGAEMNAMTHCDPTGTVCESSCKPEHYRAQAEDDPCWLIQAPNSDWEPTFFALRVVDYRE